MFQVPSSKFNGRGVTLIEIIVAIFLITVLTLILIVNFPSIQRQFALSRAAYKLAQEMRKAEDLGLSGVQVADSMGALVSAKGYGIYINRTAKIDPSITKINSNTPANKQYVLYADSCMADSKYTSPPSCTNGDYIIEAIDISKEEPGVYIKSVNTVDSNSVSVNFTPPNPNITITALSSGSEVDIVLGLDLDSSLTRTVSINTAGMIEVK